MKNRSLKLGITGIMAGCLALPGGAQVAIPEAFAQPTTAADTSKPGFIWNVFHNPANQINTNQRTEDALAGLLVDGEGNPLPNLADPAAVGNAEAEGVKLGTADNALLQFNIPGVINLDQAAGSNGSITPDEQMPGIPGIEFSDEGIAAEILTWLELSVGTHTLIVNSDDGFTLRIGGATPKDPVNAAFIGEFNGGRGATDTSMQIQVTKAGLYATRVTWEEGGGGANIEFVQVLPDNSRAAINSPESTIKAYRAITTATPTFVSSAVPTPNQGGAAFDTPINIDLFGASVTPASVRLSLDGTQVTPTVNKTGDTTAIRYQPTGQFPPLSQHSVSLAFNDGQDRTIDYTFTVTAYASLGAADKVTADTSKPGFTWDVHQNQAFQDNDNVRPLLQLAGLLGPNLADKDAQGVAIAPGTPGANDRLPIRFEIDTVINMDQAGGSNGEFTPDDQMPGIPSLEANDEGIAGDINTYIELPAGIHTFIVNSDDGFRTTAGNVRDVVAGQVAGEFSGGRGAADTSYRVVVQEAGIYPFRTVWQEGGGGANIEWKIVKADGSRALINDTANGGPKAYRAATGGLPAAVTRVRPTPNNPRTAPTSNIEAVIEDGSTPVDQASVQLAVDGSPVTAAVTKTGSTINVSYDPPADFPLASTHTVRLTFTAGTPQVREWSFTIPPPPVTRDSVANYAGFITTAQFTPDQGGRTGQAGDRAIDFGTSNGSFVYVPDMSFVNAASADNDLTFSHWQKLHSVTDSSAWWVNSPSSNNGTRGWQAHTPWSDSTVYFDTSGCCTTDTQRINLNISEYADYSGDATWWEDWHHFAFVKRSDGTKEIWIDGDLFHSGLGDPIKSDFTDMYIGSQNATANTLKGIMDDLAIFNSALTQAQIASLATGTAPGAVTGNPGLIAHWAFNDPPSNAPTISVARDGANVTVTFTGTLQASDSVTGAWADVAGTSPASLPTSGSARYFRSKQ